MDNKLIEAYHNTTYQSYNPNFSIRIDEHNNELDMYLISNDYQSWAYITAENPFSSKLTNQENTERSSQLESLLQSKSLDYASGYGIPDDPNWEAERSFLIFDISLQLATEISHQFDQNAFIFGQKNSKAQLVLNHFNK